MESKKETAPSLENLTLLAKLMDSQFRIPGTNIKFGLDALIGLVPGFGDFATFLISGYMITVLASNGASGFVLAQMVLNVIIDSVFGAIPVLGDIFDVAFKANQRNITLMQQHYIEGRHKGSAWKVIIPMLFILLIFIGGFAWLAYRVFVWLFNMTSYNT
jgi:hypothetical protein